jgi:predicted nucleic acid-binding protein
VIVYVDTSALVPLLIDEPTSAACGELWDGADKVTCTRLGYVEAVAAVALAERMGRIASAEAIDGRAILEELWTAVDVIELDNELMSAAAGLSVRHGLRGYDAVHCAAAVAANDDELVAASGDKRLIAAWRTEGVAIRDITANS